MTHKVLAAVAAVLISGAADAATVLDQQHIVTTNTVVGSASVNDFKRVQTVTVGVSGVLSEVQFQLAFTSYTPQFGGLNIYSTVNGVPNTVVGVGDYIDTFNGFARFATSLSLSLGDVIGLEMLTKNGAVPYIKQAAGNLYAGGADYYKNGASPFVEDVGYDGGFRTFVNTVPEPATWATFVGGFGLIGLAIRRRRLVSFHFA